MKKIESGCHLRLLIGAEDYFGTSFGSLEDVLNDNVWEKGCKCLHEHIKRWATKND